MYCNPLPKQARTSHHTALAAGEPAFVYEGAERLVLDSLLIVVGGVIIVLLKQALFHRREPML